MGFVRCCATSLTLYKLNKYLLINTAHTQKTTFIPLKSREGEGRIAPVVSVIISLPHWNGSLLKMRTVIPEHQCMVCVGKCRVPEPPSYSYTLMATERIPVPCGPGTRHIKKPCPLFFLGTRSFKART